MVVGGRRLCDRAAEVLTAVCHPVLEVGPGHTSLPAVRENPPGSGPLAALAAGWAALGEPPPEAGVLVLALAVDMPGVTSELVRFVATRPGTGTAVPLWRDRPQPLCARYGPATLALAPGLLERGERSLRALLDVAGAEVDWIGPEEWGAVAVADVFADIDEPGDLRRLFREFP